MTRPLTRIPESQTVSQAEQAGVQTDRRLQLDEESISGYPGLHEHPVADISRQGLQHHVHNHPRRRQVSRVHSKSENDGMCEGAPIVCEAGAECLIAFVRGRLAGNIDALELTFQLACTRDLHLEVDSAT